MQIKFKNGDLQNVYNFLTGLKIKGASVNRARFQVVKLFESKVKEFSDARTELVTQYAKKDVSGNVISKGGEVEVLPNKLAEFNSEYNALMGEDALLTIDDYRVKFRVLYNFLAKYDEELTGADGYVYGAFLDEMERVGVNHADNKSND